VSILRYVKTPKQIAAAAEANAFMVVMHNRDKPDYPRGVVAEVVAELAAATQAIQAETGKRDAAFMSQLTQRTKTAEDAIGAAKNKAMGDVRSVAAEVAAAAAAL